MQDLYQTITNQILKSLQTSDGQWQAPWFQMGNQPPRNALTKHRYQGVNWLYLSLVSASLGYDSCQWATYKQWQVLGAHVRKGERATPAVMYKRFSKENEDGKEVLSRSFMRAFNLFNACQVEGFQNIELPQHTNPIANADDFIIASGAHIVETGQKAYFDHTADRITMPKRHYFTGTDNSSATEGWYSTLLHELVHWTGHRTRLARPIGAMRSSTYAFEELIAEIGASFLCAHLNISQCFNLDNADYIAHWAKILKADKKAIFSAAAKAQEAVSYLEAKSNQEQGEKDVISAS